MRRDRVPGDSTISLFAIRSRWFRWTRTGVTLLFFVAIGSIAQEGHPAAASNQSGAGSQVQTAPAKPDAKPIKLTKQEKAAAAEDQRKQLIADESTQLLTMATALKVEVDKTNKDMLSLKVIQKADEIEKLAHAVKEKIKQSGGPG